MKHDIIRRCVFQPYRKGMGPTFTLVMWDTHRTMYGKSLLGYRLTMHHSINYAHVKTRYVKRDVVFEGEDFGCSPMHSIDGDESVEACMSFLTLRPGDTDADYFDNYTPEQMEYCQLYAEDLHSEVDRRFCDENGNVRKRGGR